MLSHTNKSYVTQNQEERTSRVYQTTADSTVAGTEEKEPA